MISLLLTDSNNINEKLNNKRSSLKNINVILLLESFVFDLVSFIIVKNLHLDPQFSVSLHSVADLSDWSLACSCFIRHPRHARLVSLIFVLAISPPPDPFILNLLLIVHLVFLASYPSTTTMPFPILPASFRPSDSISSMCLQSTRIYVCACVCIHSCTLRYKLQRSSPLDIG